MEEASCSCTLGHKIFKDVITKFSIYLVLPLNLWDLLPRFVFFSLDNHLSPSSCGNFSITLVVLVCLRIDKQAATLPPFRSFVKRRKATRFVASSMSLSKHSVEHVST
jgi:hypothetical protein